MKINLAQFVCVRGKTCKIKGFFFKIVLPEAGIRIKICSNLDPNLNEIVFGCATLFAGSAEQQQIKYVPTGMLREQLLPAVAGKVDRGDLIGGDRPLISATVPVSL